MYTLNTIELHKDLRDWCLSLTRVIYTPNAILLDIVSQIMSGKDVVPMEPNKKFYNLRSQDGIREKAVDGKALREIYLNFAPRVEAELKKYFINGIDFECGIAIRGGQLVVLTSEEIDIWEKVYGTQQLYRPY